MINLVDFFFVPLLQAAPRSPTRQLRPTTHHRNNPDYRWKQVRSSTLFCAHLRLNVKTFPLIVTQKGFLGFPCSGTPNSLSISCGASFEVILAQVTHSIGIAGCKHVLFCHIVKLSQCFRVWIKPKNSAFNIKKLWRKVFEWFRDLQNNVLSSGACCIVSRDQKRFLVQHCPQLMSPKLSQFQTGNSCTSVGNGGV